MFKAQQNITYINYLLNLTLNTLNDRSKTSYPMYQSVLALGKPSLMLTGRCTTTTFFGISSFHRQESITFFFLDHVQKRYGYYQVLLYTNVKVLKQKKEWNLFLNYWRRRGLRQGPKRISELLQSEDLVGSFIPRRGIFKRSLTLWRLNAWETAKIT